MGKGLDKFLNMMRLNDDDYDDDYDEEFSDDYNDDYSDDYDDSYDEEEAPAAPQKEENFFPQPYKVSQGTGTGSRKRIFRFCTVLFIILRGGLHGSCNAYQFPQQDCSDEAAWGERLWYGSFYPKAGNF